MTGKTSQTLSSKIPIAEVELLCCDHWITRNSSLYFLIKCSGWGRGETPCEVGAACGALCFLQMTEEEEERSHPWRGKYVECFPFPRLWFPET